MDNKKLEKILGELKAKGEAPSEEVINMLKSSTMISPATMPADTDPTIMRQMLQNPGKPQALPAGANPQPCVLENGNGKKFLAVFTSEEEMKKGKNTPKFPLTLTVSFENCIALVRKNSQIDGIVINPFTQNVIFHVEENKKPQTIQVTIEQFHILSRQKFEAFYLPKSLFEKKADYIEKLRDEQGNFLRELYEDVYDTEIACPYVPEDFEVMSLNISDELFIMRITMPAKNLVNGTCPCVIVGWNGKEEKIWYYGILLTEDGKAHLHQRKEDGTDIDLGIAPTEGSELSTVIDLIQGAEHEK